MPMTGHALTVAVVLDREPVRRAELLLEAIGACGRVARDTDSPTSVALRVADSSPRPVLDRPGILDGIDHVDYEHLAGGLDAASGYNHLAADAAGDVVLFLDSGVFPAPTMFVEITRAFENCRVGAADARRIPLEHPKDYDPVSGDTGYACAGALAVRRTVFERIGGVDAEHFSLICADIDLSWRIRAVGFKTVHTPAAVIVTDDPIDGEMKPPDFESASARLVLARKWGRDDIIEDFLSITDSHGSATDRRVARHFRDLEANDLLPTRAENAEQVAEFVGTQFTRHRWEEPWPGRT